MGFAVYHLEKGKISSGGLGNHIDRVPGMERTYKHADPSRLALNVYYPCNGYENMKLSAAIEARIKQGYTHRNKAGELKEIRKDAVKYTTHILTGSHEEMKEIEKNPARLDEWVQANRKFIEEEYGKDNLVRFVLHLDERTPHIHAVTVNITEDGRMSAKDIIGDRKKMAERQDRYAAAMEVFELKRGLKNTGIRHEDAKEYYKRINAALAEGKELEVYKEKKGIFGLNKGEKELDFAITLENYNSALIELKDRLNKAMKQLNGIWRTKKKNTEDEKKNIDAGINIAQKQLQLLDAEENLMQKEKKIRDLEYNADDYKKKKKEVAELEKKINELGQKLSQLKQYEGLSNSRKYIDESIDIREYYEANVANEVFKELTADNKIWKNRQELYNAFNEGIKEYGFKENWDTNPFFDLLEEKANIQYRSRGVQW
jgi:plasmid recombination enzyme